MFRTFLPLTFLLAATVFAQNRKIQEAPTIRSSARPNIALAASPGEGRRNTPGQAVSQSPATGREQATSGPLVTLDQAIQFAITNNPNLKASQTQIDQSQAQEITAGLRPNPTLSGDSQFVPIFNPSQFTTNTFDTVSQFDIGVGYLFERGGKRKHRLKAA